MTTDQADLRSLSILSDTEASLGRFASRAEECLQTVRSHLHHQLRELDARLQAAEWRVRECQEALDRCDDDESDQAARALAEATEKAQDISRWKGRAEAACQAYLADARRFEQTVSHQIPKSRTTLRSTREAGSAYLAYQFDAGLGTPGQTAPQPSTRPSSGSAVTASTGTPLTEFSLPRGFRWIALDRISRRDDLGADEGFDKVTEQDMRRGFGTLRRQVLPHLAAHPDADSATFRALDGYTQAGTPRSRQLVYEAFFGSEPIVLDGTYPDGTFSVTNGRHRIKIARELGWDAVPVKLIGGLDEAYE